MVGLLHLFFVEGCCQFLVYHLAQIFGCQIQGRFCTGSEPPACLNAASVAQSALAVVCSTIQETEHEATILAEVAQQIFGSSAAWHTVATSLTLLQFSWGFYQVHLAMLSW